MVDGMMVYGTSKCKICEDFRLITLHSRLVRGNHSFFPVTPQAPPRPLVRSRPHSREATSWGSDVELEEMESEQTGLAFSLPPSPERGRANLPVEFVHDFLFPSPRARDTVSFGLDDILHTAASDSEDFGPALADALPPSGQEVRPSAAYSELVDVLSRATEKLALDWPDEPRGFCGAGLHRHAGGRGYFGLPSFTLFGAFLEVPPPPSFQAV